jgi:adenine-specific DNA-methyltransferase
MAPAKRTVRPARAQKAPHQAESYKHPESTSPMRPEVGTQAQFRKRKPPATYRYDSSLSPALDWDGQNPAREQGERHLSVIEEQLSVVRSQLSVVRSELFALQKQASPDDVEKTTDNWQRTTDALGKAEESAVALKSISKPFLNWAGKAERLSFDVPTLPLFVHERLSTKAIIETLTAHRRERHPGQLGMFELFGDPQHSVTDQVLRAYEYADKWVNRMILGDSLVVMNSLLHYEGLGGQVQMIYMDPPYGVKFGSNFQPFVRKRDVSHNDDEDMTREPEMVQAYRDTWELGLHSYLTYLRDRLLLAGDLLAPSGSIFVQIGDENLHHVREVMGEVFGPENFCGEIVFRKTTGKGSALLDNTYDTLLWYAKQRATVTFNQTYFRRKPSDDDNYRCVEFDDSTRRALSKEEITSVDALPPDWRIFSANPLTSQTASATTVFEYEFEREMFKPGKGGWKTNLEGMQALDRRKRLMAIGRTLRFVRYFDDFPYQAHNDIWDDTRQSGFGEQKIYAVQTRDDHRPRRPGSRSHLRQRHHGVRGRAMGTALDHD